MFSKRYSIMKMRISKRLKKTKQSVISKIEAWDSFPCFYNYFFKGEN